MEEIVDKEWVDGIFGYSGVVSRDITQGEIDWRFARQALYRNLRREDEETVAKSIKEWLEEFPKEYRDAHRARYLEMRIEDVRSRFFAECRKLVERTDDFTHWSELHILRLEKELYRLGMEAKILKGKIEGITPEMIARARQFPITNLIQSHRGMAMCPFHRDRHPSMDVRKNFYYCYSCNAAGDVIDFLMKRDNIGFKEAINKLSY